MKSLKAAAVVAGSLLVAGFATPALALDGAGVKPADLGGAVNNAVKGVKVGGSDATDLLGSENALAPNGVQKATGALGKQGNIKLTS
ncbi:hypothetical protein [Streptomyces bullii]|uniref:ATP-binding protein n=1 Tax=Streptomyces bullii TaxID=349910 RepID=A0ABW0UK33_9ACTN